MGSATHGLGYTWARLHMGSDTTPNAPEARFQTAERV
eukprot:CAMPEP_0185184976 /NCGR_PEP_ID=MMETSP1140-20130426/2901_1 /TAXON_ID=298111 /ORGANISM="Pavlova sp., Strain CCMP459" /LENGTH=36 /DNA_ID= /DNA_START= /DNA_END= /DNA_ORIENTATION=